MTRVTIVAEAAQGFEGEPRLARLLVRAAAAAGADVVKFQLVLADELATPAYQHFALFRSLEMPEAAWTAVAEDARSAGVALAFDVFGERSLDQAVGLGATAVKLHASDFFNESLVHAVFARAPHVYVSIGGIEYDEVTTFVERAARSDRMTLMYGFQGEPTAVDDNHLARLAALRQRVAVPVGFMDHSDGDADEAGWLGVLALPYGATVIEKHITLDRALQLEDYGSALAPDAFTRYVQRIRTAERALGRPTLELTPAERDYGRRAVKGVVAARDLDESSVVRREDVTMLRAPLPPEGTPLRHAAEAVGRRTRRVVRRFEALRLEDLS